MRRTLALFALVGLVACHHPTTGNDTAAAAGDHRSDRADASGKSDDGAAPSAEDRANAKLNKYVDGYNALVSTFGLAPQFRQYLGQQIDRKTINDPVFVLPGWLDNGLSDLTKARAMSGSLPDVDAAANRLLPVLGRLVGELKGLQIYYQSRGQFADNFARGKRENPQVIADFRAALAANAQLSTAIDAAQAKRDDAELAQLKSAGDMIGYDGALAMHRSKALVNLFSGPADLADPAKQQRGDALVAEISGALADMRQRLAQAKGNADPEHGLRNSMYDSMAGNLDGMIGSYRDLRRAPNAFVYQAMVSSYNQAVDSANMG